MLVLRHRIVAAILIALTAFAIYFSNGQWNGSYDSASNSVLTFNVLERGRLDLDGFRDSYFTGLGGQYAFIEAPNGHLAPLFPVGSAILAAPVYAMLLQADRMRGYVPNITAPSFEPERRLDERMVAAFLAAISVAAFFFCAMRIGTPTQALIATFVYAFASSIWTIASQALWQHGPVNLCLLIAIYGLLRGSQHGANRSAGRWSFVAGLAAGFLPVVRPTALAFLVAVILYVLVYQRSNIAAFCAGAAVGLLPGIAWNGYFFHTVLGGYEADRGQYSPDVAAALRDFAGLLVSPSRGILIYTPVFLFSIWGAVAAYRSRRPEAQLIVFLSIASIALVVNYAVFTGWWGGFTYGPRFLTDCDAVAALALIFVLPPTMRGWRVAFAAPFAVFTIWSIGAQVAGAYGGAAGADWNAVPVSIDTHPGRLWAISDNQIERNARAFYFKTFAWSIASTPQYVKGVRASVQSVTTNADVTSAVVENTGSVPLYGYDSGVYVGQMRLRAPNATLYLRGTLLPGQTGTATGIAAGTRRADELVPMLLNVAGKP